MADTFLKIPVNLTDAGDDLVLHAAMPGAEPENIRVTFTAKSIILHSTMRGMLASDKKPLKQEWHIGEYHRCVRTPKFRCYQFKSVACGRIAANCACRFPSCRSMSM